MKNFKYIDRIKVINPSNFYYGDIGIVKEIIEDRIKVEFDISGSKKTVNFNSTEIEKICDGFEIGDKVTIDRNPALGVGSVQEVNAVTAQVKFSNCTKVCFLIDLSRNIDPNICTCDFKYGIKKFDPRCPECKN